MTAPRSYSERDQPYRPPAATAPYSAPTSVTNQIPNSDPRYSTDPAAQTAYADKLKGAIANGYGAGYKPPEVGGGASDFTPYSAPGYGEQWWKQHGDEFTQPGPAQNYWNGQQGFFANPTQGETSASSYGQELGGTTGAMENFYDYARSTGEYTNPWAAEGAYKDNQNYFQAPGSMETFWQNNQNALSGPSQLGLHQQGIEQDINSARATQGFWGSQGANLAKKSYNENLADNYRSVPSFSEDFYTGGGATQGLDAVYDRLYSQGERRLGNAAAARGGFNSGAALRGIEEFSADTNAQHVKDIQAAAAQGDVSKMARLKHELDLGTGADTSLRGRIATGIEGAHTADQSAIERAGASQKLYEGMGNETRQNLTTSGNLANMSQRSGLDRILGQTTAATAADNSRTSRNTLGINAANDAQSQNRDRLKTASDIEIQGQDAALRRLQTGGDLSRSAGVERNTGLTGGAAGSVAAERVQIDRESGVMRNLMDVANSQASKYEAMTQDQRNAEWEVQKAMIDGKLNEGRISAEQAQQMSTMYMEMLKIPLSAISPGVKK